MPEPEEWYFTREEGGQWIAVEVNDPNFHLKIIGQLTDKQRWIEKGNGKSERTALSCMPGYIVLFVHSVRFPDGRIWDSTFRQFDASTPR
jgi:hypothetical protein